MNKNNHQNSPTGSGSTGCDCSAAGLRVLDLFSGIGGFSLGLERAGMRTIAFCEIEKFPRSILRKHWPDVPIFDDVRTLYATDLPESVELICGGYPCQPFSVAGKRRGKEDNRHLWPEIVRIIREFDAAGNKPSWCVFENVAGHISMGLDSVLADLEGENYTCWPLVIPACAVNAPHRRDRVWIIANSNNAGLQKTRAEQQATGSKQYRKLGAPVANSSSTGRQKRNIATKSSYQRYSSGRNIAEFITNAKSKQAGGVFKPWFSPNSKSGGDWRGKTEGWTTEPPICGTDDGVPNRVARLKALGNAVVPQIPEMIGHAIMAAEAMR